MDAYSKNIGYPEEVLPFEQKLTQQYGLSIANVIANDWFDRSTRRITGNCNMFQRSMYVRKKRLFVRGEYDVAPFKEDYSNLKGQLELVNMDFTPINWGEKFARIVSNGISDKNYKLDIRATDRLATLQKEGRENYYRKYMESSTLLEKSKKLLGVDIKPKDFIPEDDQSLKIQMEIKDRPKVEIAEEILIDYVLNTSGWDFTSEQTNKDLVDSGLMVARVYIDKNNGIMVDYVDIENYVHSMVTRNDFADKKYEGVVVPVTLSDIRREGGYNDDQLREIAKSALNTRSSSINYDNCLIDDILDTRVHVLRFAYKTSKNIVYKKKMRNGETIKMDLRKEENSGPKEYTVNRILDTWLEGNFIVGTKYLYDYKECENLYDDVMNKAMSPFITLAYDIYENRLRSFTDNIEPQARQLQRISLKIQHLVKELKPDGIGIDLDMLAELDDSSAESNQAAWQNALNIFAVKGVVFTKRINMGDDGPKDREAVRPMAYQQGSALTPLLNTWAHYYNNIRENTGINPARDGSAPADSLVGVNQLAQLASNTVTKNIVETSTTFKKKISEVISTRIGSIFRYKEAEHLRKIYENVVGKNMLDHLEILKDRHLHEFAFTFEMLPTQEEVSEFKEDLTLALQEGSIDPQIKAEAVRIARVNIKLAIEYIMFHRREKIKEKKEERAAEIQMQSQSNIQAAQAASQASAQEYEFKAQVDLKKAAGMSQIKVAETQAIQQIQQPVREQEFQEEVAITKIKAGADWAGMKYAEDRKDDRTNLQATQQSKLKKQAQTDGEPIDFEAEDNWFQPQL